MLVSFHAEKRDWENFKRIVGYGNASPTLRNFVLSYGEKTDISERKLLKEFEILSEDYKKIKNRYDRMKIRVDEMDTKTKQKELDRIKKEEKFRQKMLDIEYETKKKDSHRL